MEIVGWFVDPKEGIQTMAVQNDNGRKRISYRDAAGKRRTIRLGRVSMRKAREVDQRVKQIVRVQRTGDDMDPRVANWIAEIKASWPQLADKMHSNGLISGQTIENPLFTDYVRERIECRSDAKPATLKVWRQTLAYIETYLSGRRLQSLTRGCGRDYLRSLKAHEFRGKKLSSATVGKYFSFTRGFLNQAVDAELIGKNPFSGVLAPRTANRKRQEFVPHGTIYKVIEAAPDAEMRLIIALSRFGGLRVPSELFELRWDGIDWANNRIHFRSPKTEHHEGHESREIPLFPELLPYLLDAKELAGEDATGYVISKRRTLSGAALRRQMARCIQLAKVAEWPRVFHNLRASRQTELEDEWPSHVVNGWMGNSEKVSRKHYLQITDGHFEKAAGGGAKIGAADGRNPSQRTAAEEKRKAAHPTNRRESGSSLRNAPTRETLRSALTGMDGNRTHLATFQPPQRI